MSLKFIKNFRFSVLQQQNKSSFVLFMSLLLLVCQSFFSCEIPSAKAQKDTKIVPPQTQIPDKEEIPVWIQNYHLLPPESILLQKQEEEQNPNLTESSPNPKLLVVKSILSADELANFYRHQTQQFGFSLLADIDGQEARLLQFAKESREQKEDNVVPIKEVLTVEIVSLPYASQQVARLGYSKAEYPLVKNNSQENKRK